MKKNLKKLIVLFTCLTILLSVSMVQVYAAPSISAKKVSVYVGKTKQLKVSGTSTSVKWTTSNSKVATVSSKGLIKGKIVNCVVSNTNITGSISNSCGGVCGLNDGIVQNCTVKNLNTKASTESYSDSSAGCVVGKNSGSIISCSAENINASGYIAGGITGVNNNSGQCVMCEVTGVVKVGAIVNWGAGAIAGINQGTVSSCSTTSGIKLVGYGSGIVA